MKLKICGLKNLDNLLEVTGKIKPDYVGHIFYPKSKRFIEDRATVTTPISPARVGVFVNETNEKILDFTDNTQIYTLQLHGSESPEQCQQLQKKGYRIIKAFGIDEEFDFNTLNEYKYSCDYYLFDTKSPQHGGTGKSFNWELLKKYNNNKPLFLSGGLSLENIDNRLKDFNIYALDVNSKFESSPGIKDLDLLLQLREKLDKLV